MPSYDVAIAEHVVVGADPATSFAAARDLDFLTVRTPLLDVSMWARSLPARLRGEQTPAPPRLRLASGEGAPGWLSLGEAAGEEIAFGAVGRFWQPAIRWRDVTTAEFAAFGEPGYGKIACNFTVRPYGPERTLLSYECRTATTDQASRREFARYWRVIRPFVRHIMRATLAQVRANAEHAVTADRPAQITGAR